MGDNTYLQLGRTSSNTNEIEKIIFKNDREHFIKNVYCGKGYTIWHEKGNKLSCSAKFKNESYYDYFYDVKYADVCGEYFATVVLVNGNYEAALWRITVEKIEDVDTLDLEPFAAVHLYCEPTEVACGDQFFAVLCQGTVFKMSFKSGVLEQSIIFTYSPTIVRIKASNNYVLGLDGDGNLHIHGHIDGLPSRLEECQIARNVRKFYAFAQHIVYQTNTFEIWGIGMNDKGQLCTNLEDAESSEKIEPKKSEPAPKKIPFKYARPAPIGISGEVYAIIGGLGYTGIFTAPFDYCKLCETPKLLTPAMLSSPPVNTSAFLPDPTNLSM